MAINPNTDFTAGNVLTAAQMNRFPRGIVAQATRTSTLNFDQTEDIGVTASTFTAVANRYYRITYLEPDVRVVESNQNVTQRIRLTNVTGTILGETIIVNPNTASGARWPMTTVALATFSAGSVVVIGSLLSSFTGGAIPATATATKPAVIIVEDIGPA